MRIEFARLPGVAGNHETPPRRTLDILNMERMDRAYQVRPDPDSSVQQYGTARVLLEIGC